MNITRYNYEEYFLLYVDNELSPGDRNAVEVFLNDNTDLREELVLLQQSVLRADKRTTFEDKASLLKNSTHFNPVNEANYEEYFLLYRDDELSNEEKDQVEQFVYKHPRYQAAFELFEKVQFTPDTTIVFADKKSLYRREKDERVVIMRWWRIAAAAVLLLFIGGAALYFPGSFNGTHTNEIARGTVDTPSIKPSFTAPAEKDQIAQTLPGESKTTGNIITPGKKSTGAAKRAKQNIIKEQEPVLVKNIYREKINSETTSNIRTETIVTPKEINSVSRPIIDEAVNLEKPAINGQSSEIIYANNTSEQITVLNTSISNKSKMRGFFRKVGRVVDKATSFGNGDNREDKKGLRIASFEIALK